MQEFYSVIVKPKAIWISFLVQNTSEKNACTSLLKFITICISVMPEVLFMDWSPIVVGIVSAHNRKSTHKDLSVEGLYSYYCKNKPHPKSKSPDTQEPNVTFWNETHALLHACTVTCTTILKQQSQLKLLLSRQFVAAQITKVPKAAPNLVATVIQAYEYCLYNPKDYLLSSSMKWKL